MYDVKAQINGLLSAIPDVQAVTDAFPTNFGKLPAISFYELGNSDPLTIAQGPLSDISIQVDIWHKKSTGALAQLVDAAMNSVGFRRQFSSDVPDASGIKRKTMRYRGVVDARTERVSQ